MGYFVGVAGIRSGARKIVDIHRGFHASSLAGLILFIKLMSDTAEYLEYFLFRLVKQLSVFLFK